jgi:hypothetical protein
MSNLKYTVELNWLLEIERVTCESFRTFPVQPGGACLARYRQPGLLGSTLATFNLASGISGR